MWHSGSTGPEGLEADLVYVRKGGKRAFSEKDVDGKVVLVSWGYRIINLIAIASLYPSYDRAMENGAGGYIQFFTNTPGNAFQLTDAGSLLGEADAGANTLPGLSIGKEDARYLKALLEKGEVRVRMTLKGQDRETDTYTIMAMLPGRTDDIILIDTHYCSIFTGAFDNATGVASSLALARYFSEIPESERDKTLLFNFYGSHEYAGCNVGANKFYKRHPELIEKLVIDIGLDHMAAYPWKEYFGHMTRIRPWTPVPGMDQPRGVFISENPALYSIVFPAIFKYRLIPFLVFPNKLMAMCETGVLYNQGIAALRITQCPPWYHTPLDTMDKFSPSQLKRAVDAHIEIVEKIDRIPADRFRKMDINLGPAIDGCGGIAPEQGMKGNLIHKIMTKDKNKNP
jgi:Zn-dependent M28 family amino/carboxypeptidase